MNKKVEKKQHLFESFVTFINILNITVVQFNASLLNKSIYTNRNQFFKKEKKDCPH